jgi:hypothetical protein
MATTTSNIRTVAPKKDITSTAKPILKDGKKLDTNTESGTGKTDTTDKEVKSESTTPEKKGAKEYFMEFGVPVLVGGGLGFGGMKLAQHFNQNKWLGLGVGFAVGATATYFGMKHFMKPKV